MTMNKSPIGFFDSGYGGLTILKEVQSVLPEYDYLYLGDNARAPYGTRSFDVVYDYTWQCVKYLLEQGCDLVIVACNTASAKALRSIQQVNLRDYPGKRVLGVIRPSAEVVGNLTRSRHIGILATEGTVKSNSYVLEIEKFAPDVVVNQLACPLWVPLIENLAYNSEEGIGFIRKDVEAILKSDPLIDTIILGCTHYPIVMDVIKEVVSKDVVVVSQGPIVAKAMKEYLSRHSWLVKKLSTKKQMTFLTTESVKEFNENANRIFGWNIQAIHIQLDELWR